MRVVAASILWLFMFSSAHANGMFELLAFNGAVKKNVNRIEKVYEYGLHMRPITFVINDTGSVRVCILSRSIVLLLDDPEQKKMVRATYHIFDQGCTGAVSGMRVAYKGRFSPEATRILHEARQELYDEDVDILTQIERNKFIFGVMKPIGWD